MFRTSRQGTCWARLRYATAPPGYEAAIRGEGDTRGVLGVATADGMGIVGNAEGSGHGVFGDVSGTGAGVFGYARATSGANFGVRGTTESQDGFAGYFEGRGYFSGNLGLGTTSPETKLQLDGALSFVRRPGDISNAGTIAYRTFLPSGDALDIIGAGTTNTNRRVHVFDILTVGDTSGSQFNVNLAYGVVGIGTTSPGAQLHVVGPGGGSLAARIGALSGINGMRFDGASAGGGNVSTSLAFYDNGQPISTWQVNANHTADMFLQRMQLTSQGLGGPTQLQIVSPNSEANLDFYSDGTGQCTVYSPSGTDDLYFLTGGANRAVITASGNVGIGISTPRAKLVIENRSNEATRLLHLINDLTADGGGGTELYTVGGPNREIGLTNSWSDLHFGASDSGAGFVKTVTVKTNGNVGIGTTSPAAKLHVVGTTRTGVVEITGGSDLAEPFDVLHDDANSRTPQPGMLVVIDPKNPGKLCVATEAYDRKVAGVISGANGLSPGMLMKAEGREHVDGDYPVALAGRVWCYADATFGAITPGDLLTTSGSPGYAMRVADDTNAPRGCILGKAMTPLAGTRGLVLVLVNLQ